MTSADKPNRKNDSPRSSRKFLPDQCEVPGCPRSCRARIGGLAACLNHYVMYRKRGTFKSREAKIKPPLMTLPSVLTCNHCQSSFVHEHTWAKYCSSCRDPVKGGLRQCLSKRERRRPAVESKTFGPFTCSYCGEEFMSKKRTRVTCSTKCIRMMRAERARRSAAVSKDRRIYRAWSRKAAAAERNKARAEERAARLSWHECRECGSPFQSGRAVAVFCSEQCSSKDSRRTSRKKRKAAIRAARVESVNPTTVFDRDGWRCQLCGRMTSRSKRGTCHPNAPELDHIMPLSKGGEHSYKNTQCTCRACNHAKSDVELGQRRMF